MIQRIQSLYWLGAIICLSFLNFGATIFEFKMKNSTIFYSVFKIEEIINGKIISSNPKYYYLVFIAFTVLTLFSIFSFKNRKRQIRIGTWVNTLLISNFLVFTTFGFTDGFIVTDAKFIFPGVAYYMLIGAIIFNFLALKAVKKDKNLLDSVDRIR